MVDDLTENDSYFMTYLLYIEGFLVVACTYYYLFLKSGYRSHDESGRACHCEQCSFRYKLTKYLLFMAWFLFVCTYFRENTQTETVPFDPFAILRIQPDATMHQIKSAYNKLRVLYDHPDKASRNEDRLRMLNRAYYELLQPQKRKKWKEKINNVVLGYAIPAWFADPENLFWVSIIYLGLLLLPLCVVILIMSNTVF